MHQPLPKGTYVLDSKDIKVIYQFNKDSLIVKVRYGLVLSSYKLVAINKAAGSYRAIETVYHPKTREKVVFEHQVKFSSKNNGSTYTVEWKLKNFEGTIRKYKDTIIKI